MITEIHPVCPSWYCDKAETTAPGIALRTDTYGVPGDRSETWQKEQVGLASAGGERG